MVTRLMQQRDDFPPVSARVQHVEQLPFHLFRLGCSGGHDYRKPVASVECAADLIVPPLGATQVGFAVPVANPMVSKHFYQTIDEFSVRASV